MQHDRHLPPTIRFPVSPVEVKYERPHFDVIEVIEAESQAVGTVHTRGWGGH
jgi:hypothetical protein